MGPPPLFIKLWELDPLRQPNGYVIVQGTAFLKFSDPNVAEGNASLFAPLADGFEAFGDVARFPVIHTSIGEGDKPDVFTLTSWTCKAMEMTGCPDLSS